MPISKKEMQKRRNRILEKSFELFCKHTINGVTFQEIADETGLGVASVYRYFPNKIELAAAVHTQKWIEFLTSVPKGYLMDVNTKQTAFELLDCLLDLCVELYATRQNLLLFTEDFSSFIRQASEEGDVPRPYEEVARLLDSRFKMVYRKALEDHTVRTDLPEEYLKRDIINTMMASCIYHAKGNTLFGDTQRGRNQCILRMKQILLNYAKPLVV